MSQNISAANFLTRTVDRNRYFYGKLMTVRDFLREQEYFNSKRWLINRLLFGSGIVCGLNVKPGGGATVVDIEPGLAFDPAGQEITVVNLEKVDLSLVAADDGVRPGGEGVTEKDLLVCLKYHECPKEPVPSLKGSPCDEVCESNRVGETFTVRLKNAQSEDPPTPCDKWLNRRTISRRSDNYDAERIAPVWVRAGSVFEVAVKVTARAVVPEARLTETVSGGATLIEPTPTPPSQFPTPPVSLRKGEFFVYVYQVQAPAAPGVITISGGAGVPTPSTTVEVIANEDAAARESERRIASCLEDETGGCVPVARIKATFTGPNLTGVEIRDTLNRQRFKYNLSSVAEMLDCVRATLQAEAGSQRPGHAFITFKDLENTDLRPIGPAAEHGSAFTVTRGDHVHPLLLFTNSGLQFEVNQLRINGDVGGDKIKFLRPVTGQTPLNPEHLATKGYVDSRLAGLDWQESVITKKLVVPPDDPKEGDRYLILGAGKVAGLLSLPKKNPWAAHVGSIATWNGRAWEYAPAEGEPDEGTAVFVDDEQIAYLYIKEKEGDRTAGKWIPFLATPEVAAGNGLRADGAVLSVGQGPGLKVNENDVEVVFEANQPQPVGESPGAGASNTAARGDHTHELPLAALSGLTFGVTGAPDSETEKVFMRAGLHINGPVGGANIDFRHPVWGQTPTDPRHLVTKQYVDGIAAGLDWQNSVLDKDLTFPPMRPLRGSRYLILRASGRFPFPTDPLPPEPFPTEPLPTELLPAEQPRETDLPTRPLPPGETESSLRVESPPAGELPPEEEEARFAPLPTEPIPGPVPPKPGEVPPEPPPPRPLPDPLPPIGLNPWAAHVGSIAAWDGLRWSYTPPNEGMAVFVEDENTTYLYADGRWVPFMAMPSVAAGQGLRADGAILSVGQGRGLRVNIDDVNVVYEQGAPAMVSRYTSPGTADTAARGDHQHELPLARAGGLEFVSIIREEDERLERLEGEEIFETDGLPRLRVNGLVNGESIVFQHPVWGHDPLEPRHLATKQYVDNAVSGLTWQSTVLDKDLTSPPGMPDKGDRYLILTGTPGGEWKGNPGSIATWGGRKWAFTAPVEGMATFVADENLAYLFADGKWVQFLAPPPTVGAGSGLVFEGGDLAVGPGDGVIVGSDGVSVSFGKAAPPPVGVAGTTGRSLQAAQSDHTHELPLAELSGLEFATARWEEQLSTSALPERPTLQQRLRINGQIGGRAIDFLAPVSGQTPTDARHLATKQYVDEKGLSAVAGAGLVGKDNVLSVGGGPGVIVDPDEVAVNFENGLPQPVGRVANPGTSNTAARGDHVHAMPDVWTPNATTGVVLFDLKGLEPVRQVAGPVIDPALGEGVFSVSLGLEISDGSVFVGEVDQFETLDQSENANPGSALPGMPPVNLGVTILPPSESREQKRNTFQIWAHTAGRAEFLPEVFSVRWWAYRAGKDFGVTRVGFGLNTPVEETK